MMFLLLTFFPDSFFLTWILFLQINFNQCQYLVTIQEIESYVVEYLKNRSNDYYWIVMRDQPKDCPGFLHGRSSKNSSMRLPFLNDIVTGIHTHYLIWWKQDEIKYFSQTKIYRWLQTQREHWTLLRRQYYQKYKGEFDAGEYFNMFKMEYMQQAFVIFDHEPPTL